MKLAPWVAGSSRTLYHWCPACEELHVIPPDGWTRSGTDERPTFAPSFGQHTRRGYCHYLITDGQLIFQGDCYHSVRGAVPMPDIPEAKMVRLNGSVITEAVVRK